MWSDPLVPATLLKRYKRFLADVVLADGSTVTVHCPNTGAMTGCAEPGSRIWLSQSDNPKRKYRYTWELVETAGGEMACVHSALANRVVEAGLREGLIPELAAYRQISRELKYGDGSRIDLLLSDPGECYVEVKSVTLAQGGGLGVFPDAVSARGSRHLRELMTVVASGKRAVLMFAVLHTGIDEVAPADAIDPVYGDTLREALAAGVEVLAYGAEVGPQTLRLSGSLPVQSRDPRQA